MNLQEDNLSFSESYPLETLSSNESIFLKNLDHLKQELNFPAIRNDIGMFFNFLVRSFSLKNIFEFGSGYGHSAFWYFVGDYSPENIFLTEKRSDLLDVFNSLQWSEKQKTILQYHQGDAFDKLKEVSNIDFLLIDGVKADYKRFLSESISKLSRNAIVAIDNTFWKGSVIHDGLVSKSSEAAIRDLHIFLKSEEILNYFILNYFPYRDGLILLKKR